MAMGGGGGGAKEMSVGERLLIMKEEERQAMDAEKRAWDSKQKEITMEAQLRAEEAAKSKLENESLMRYSFLQTEANAATAAADAKAKKSIDSLLIKKSNPDDDESAPTIVYGGDA
jgi:hypothetical protein